MGISLAREEIEVLAKAIAAALVRELPALEQTASAASARTRLEIGPLIIDTARHEVLVGGVEPRLQRREFAVLETLARNAGTVLSREQLLDLAWPVDIALEMETTRNVDVMIRRLRMKLGDAGKLIETVNGHGYKLRDR